MNYICTWFCADSLGEESKYSQSGEISSSARHHAIYWKCILTFFTTSRFFNATEKHLLFTNVISLPIIDGIDLNHILKNLEVPIVYVDFKFKTPNSYHNAWGGQFYEFSILDYIAQTFPDHDQFLLLDSDCIFRDNVSVLFSKTASNNGFLSYVIEYEPAYYINGINGFEIKLIYEDLLNRKLHQVPEYHAGEFFLSNVKNIKVIIEDFKELWPILLKRHKDGLTKFNEEAHTLSFIYYKNGFNGGTANNFIRRIWTNPVFYRNIKCDDFDLIIWHLPSEKQVGIKRLFSFFSKNSFSLNYSRMEFLKILEDHLWVGKLNLSKLLHYYFLTSYNSTSRYIRNGYKNRKISTKK